MEKICLLHEVIPHDDLFQTLFPLMINISEFEYGRFYQLVIDKSRNIKHSRDRPRRYRCSAYMRSKTKIEILEEAYAIIDHYKYKRKSKVTVGDWWRISRIEPIVDDFYYGRCFQFLLDTNAKTTIDDLLAKEDDEVILDAHKLKVKILEPNPMSGDEYRVDCDECSTWYHGDKRCSCGNRRCYLSYNDYVESLDDTSLECYAEVY